MCGVGADAGVNFGFWAVRVIDTTGMMTQDLVATHFAGLRDGTIRPRDRETNTIRDFARRSRKLAEIHDTGTYMALYVKLLEAGGHNTDATVYLFQIRDVSHIQCIS